MVLHSVTKICPPFQVTAAERRCGLCTPLPFMYTGVNTGLLSDLTLQGLITSPHRQFLLLDKELCVCGGRWP